MTPVAKMVGSNRVVTGNGIVSPLGGSELSPEEEHRVRRRILEQALKKLAEPAAED
jgi:hypothetical protein